MLLETSLGTVLGTVVGYFVLGLGLERIIGMVLRKVLVIARMALRRPGSADNFDQGDSEVVRRLQQRDGDDGTRGQAWWKAEEV